MRMQNTDEARMETEESELRKLYSVLNWVLRFLKVLKHKKRLSEPNLMALILTLTDFFNESVDTIEEN
jgi:hypothetical protein